MKKFSKIISTFLTLAIVINFVMSNNVAYAANSSITDSSIVYVDGVPFQVTVNAENGEITVQSTNKSDDSSLVISENGESVATVYDEDESEYKDYNLQVEDFSYEDVDITVEDESGKVVEEYNSIDDILDEDYSGQAAITIVVGITLETLLAAALEAAACIAIAGIIYYGANAAVKAIEKSAKKQKYYYKAYVYKNNVFINITNRISRASAASILKAGSSTYTYTAGLAKQIVNDAGGPCSAKDISNNKGKLNFYHYHIGTIKKHTSAHSFYGIGVMK